MKVQCPACREIVPMEEFSTSPEGLRFRCPACAATQFLPNPGNLPAGAEEDEAGPPETTPVDPEPPPGGGSPPAAEPAERVCPKCGHAQPGGEACNRCGLNFLRFDPANLPPDPAEAAALWAQVLERPEDVELHERFLAACNQAERIDYATRQYRLLARQPGRQAIAERMRARIVILAQAQLAPVLPGSDRQAVKQRGRLIWWILLGLLLAGFGLLVYYSSDMLRTFF